MERCVDGRPEPAAPFVMLPDSLCRESEQSERPPAESVREEDDERDRHEQDGAKAEAPLPGEAQPQPEREEGQRHREREVDETEQEGVVVDEQQREDRGGRKAVVDLAGDEQEAGDGQRRDRDDDQLDRRLEAEDRPQQLDQQVDPEVADRRPVILVIALQQLGAGDVELDPVAAEMTEQVHQRRIVRIE